MPTAPSATRLRLERLLPLLVAVVVVEEGRAQQISTVDPVEGSGGRVECRLVPHQLQADCRADQPRLAVSVEAARIPRTVRVIRQIQAVRQVDTRSLRLQGGRDMDPS